MRPARSLVVVPGGGPEAVPACWGRSLESPPVMSGAPDHEEAAPLELPSEHEAGLQTRTRYEVLPLVKTLAGARVQGSRRGGQN